ncbi:MAG: PTS sugar transporter subunit IIC [Bacilli bacterium]|uniref:PTS mannose/fructose/sorbose/N-acetylgalactosamine transporter subunit IIC n=1 Tax=Anaerorhabdus sp. TaxID=1872524 RepID=UPI002FC5AA3A
MIETGLLCALSWMIVNGIDRLLSWQTLARPLVTATLTGFLLGDLTTGVIMAASLEAIFMGISAIGGSIPSDPCASSIIAVAFTITSGSDIETGLALAIPIGTIMATINEMYKPILASLAPYWERLIGTGNVKMFRIQNIFMALFVDKLPQAIILFIAIAYGIGGLESFIASLPGWVMSGLSASSSMMTGVGFAILTSMIWDKEIGGFFFVGFVLAKYLKLATLPIAILAAVVAMMYFYNQKQFSGLKLTANKADSNDEEEFF